MKKVTIMLFCLTMSAGVLKAQDKKVVNASNAQSVPAVADVPVLAVTPTVDPNAGKFKFKEETHDFGTVQEGPLAEYDFEFTNVGKKPITITDAKGSCGCTVPTWPREPILPNKSAKIHVAYTTNGRPGQISKDVIITSDATQSPMVLHITGSVTPKPVETKPAETPAKQ